MTEYSQEYEAEARKAFEASGSPDWDSFYAGYKARDEMTVDAALKGLGGNYRPIDCPHCGRRRVQSDGVCEKCLWDVDGNDYASITRPDEYDTQGFIFHKPDENLIL